MSGIRLPALIYATPAGAKSSDDLRYGDLTEQQLKSAYHLDDISTKVDPYRFTKKDPVNLSPMQDYDLFNKPSTILIDPFKATPSRFSYLQEDENKNKISKEECVSLLFDELRSLSRPFALYGLYSGLIVKMINHLQSNSGLRFRDPLLNMALKDQIMHDFSSDSSLKRIKYVLVSNIDWKLKIFPEIAKSSLTLAIGRGIVPKFDRLKDRVNGMGITVHDTYATQITLKALSISNTGFDACINYKSQDHFGLDKDDILKGKFNSLRFFRIWFILQRYEKLAFKPFVTEMEADVYLSGGRP